MLGRLKGLLWAVSYLLFLGPAWPPVKLLGLWALVWSPGEGAQSGVIGQVLKTVGGVLPGIPRSWLASGKGKDFFQSGYWL